MTILRVVDFETSGFDLPAAEVCEVGVCDFHLEDRRIDLPKTWLCAVKEMPPEARCIHHISLDDLLGALPFDPSYVNGTEHDAIVAHSAEFETKFFTPDKPVICTYKAALRIWPDAPSHSNGALRYWLQDQGKIAPVHALTQPSHRAGPDAYTTAHILMALFDAGSTGKQMVGWTREPALLPRCPIGDPWRGKPWSEVDGGFLGWMLRKPDMEADLKWNANRELERRARETAS